MIKIRNGVFETNSSSVHSLVIKKSGHRQIEDEVLKNIYLTKNGVYNIYDYDIYFDRAPFRILFTAIEKFLYLYAESNDEKRIELMEFMKTTFPKIKEYKFPSVYNDEYEPFYGEVDHQSKGFVSNYLKTNNIDFKEFILNTKYNIIIDGDEYGEWEKIKESGLINLAEIEIDVNPFNSEIKTYEDETE